MILYKLCSDFKFNNLRRGALGAPGILTHAPREKTNSQVYCHEGSIPKLRLGEPALQRVQAQTAMNRTIYDDNQRLANLRQLLSARNLLQKILRIMISSREL